MLLSQERGAGFPLKTYNNDNEIQDYEESVRQLTTDYTELLGNVFRKTKKSCSSKKCKPSVFYFSYCFG